MGFSIAHTASSVPGMSQLSPLVAVSYDSFPLSTVTLVSGKSFLPTQLHPYVNPGVHQQAGGWRDRVLTLVLMCQAGETQATAVCGTV